MGLIFTLIFVLAAYLSPETIFGELTEYHIELMLALLALLGSFFAAGEQKVFKPIQATAVIGLTFAVALSWIFNGLKWEVWTALLNLLPNVMVYFLVAINCKKKIHLQMLVGVLLFTALFNIYEGYKAAKAGDEDSPRIVMQHGENGDFPRIQALSFLGDPNDFAQMLIATMPCLLLLWRKGSGFRNILLVYVPAGLLIYGTFLTHSRGALIAMVAAGMVASRRRFGTIRSAIVAGVLFMGLSATGWTGGRDLSAASGTDRTDAWSEGLELLKAHPVLGVGFTRMPEYYPITAHNTLVVCAAELGMFGLFFWMLFAFSTVRDAGVTSNGLDGGKKKKKREEDEARPVYLPADLGLSSASVSKFGMVQPYLQFSGAGAGAMAGQLSAGGSAETSSLAEGEEGPAATAEIQRMGSVMLISLGGFLAAGWFLSRAFTMTFFLLGGMVQVIYRMGLERKIVAEPLVTSYAMKRAFQLSLAGVAVMWLFLRFNNLTSR